MASEVRPALTEHAPAKVNLTLEVHGRRADGYHELERLVAFAQVGDTLGLAPDRPTGLRVRGPFAAAAGAVEDNLVLKAVRELASRIGGLALGRFSLVKRLPVAAGIGGGSSDAAAALRLVARLNCIDDADPRIADAALATGADVPVCLGRKPRVMRGIGEQLSAPLELAPIPAVLVNPGIAVMTREVFAALRAPGCDQPRKDIDGELSGGADRLLAILRRRRNDLEAAAIRLAPVVAAVLAELREAPGCELARMSGSGGCCFGIFRSSGAASAAARALRAARPGWWVRATALG